MPFDSEKVALDLCERTVEVADFSTQGGSDVMARKYGMGEDLGCVAMDCSKPGMLRRISILCSRTY